MNMGDSPRGLSASVYPSSATSTVTWSVTSGYNVVSVNSSGYVTAKSPGDAVVAATSTINNVSGYCRVHVNPADPTGISISPSSRQSLPINGTLDFSYSLRPSYATTSVSWSLSGDTNAASLSSSGRLTGKAEGTVRVTVSTSNGYSDYCYVDVYKPVPSSISFAANSQNITMPVGDSRTLSYTVSPQNAIYTVTWDSDNKDVATVTQSGRVEAISTGTAHITVTTDNGKKATSTVTVCPRPTAIKVKPESLKMLAGDMQDLTYTVTPSNAAYTVTWDSDNKAVADVSSTGKVTAKAEGTAHISVTTDNGKTSTCTVTVPTQASGVTVSAETLSLLVGGSQTLSYVVQPEDAVYRASWSSDNENVATVDDKGRVEAKALGTAHISVTTNNGKKATCTVKVCPHPTSIIVNPQTLCLFAGESQTLTCSAQPADAIYTVTWLSDNRKVAEVDKNGNVAAKGAGTAHIVVKTDNGQTDTCTVTVPVQPTSVSINHKNVELLMDRSLQLSYTVYPADAVLRGDVIWASSNSNIAYINQAGRLEARKPGTAIITVTTDNGKVGECRVIVPTPQFQLFVWLKNGEKTGYLSTDKPQFRLDGDVVKFTTSHLLLNIPKDALDKFTLEQVLPEHPLRIAMTESLKVGVDRSKRLYYELTPADASTQITWLNSDTTVVSVTADGVVTGLKAGTATLKAQTSNGLRATCLVTVPEPAYRFYVWLRDGSVESYSTDEKPKVAVGTDVFTLTTSTTTIGYAAKDVLKFTLEDSAVRSVEGDINRDGQLTVEDITTLIAIYLGELEAVKYDADLDGDGSVTVADITQLINLYLKK